MTRRISITFPENNTEAIAELLEKEAPKTCEAIWGALEVPAVNRCIHAMYCGRELIFGLPAPNQHQDLMRVPQENEIIIPVPGDICFKYFAPYELNKSGAEAEHNDGFFDVMVFYGRNARLFSSQGWVPSNLFARVVENLEGIAEMGACVHKEGMREMRIARAD